MTEHKKWVERVASVAVAVLTVAIFLVSMYFERQLNNQKLMFYQMQSIRTSINLYKAIKGHNPATLRELVFSEYKFPGEEVLRRYIENPNLDEAGDLVDPFGHPYLYDSESGWIRSTTGGYEYW